MPTDADTLDGLDSTQFVRSDVGTYVEAKRFGVDTSSSDNSSDLQSAIDYVHNLGGGTVHIHEGTFITDTIIIKTGVKLKGSGRSTTTLEHKSGAGGLTVHGKNAGDIEVSDLTIDYSKAAQNDGCIAFSNVENGVMKRLLCTGGWNATIYVGDFYFNDGPSKNCKVIDCIAEGQRNWSGNSKAQLIAADYAENTLFRDCISKNSQTQADLGSSDHGLNTKFENCQFDGSSGGRVGIWVENNTTGNSEKVLIKGCDFLNLPAGVGVTEDSYCRIDNSYFENCSQRGVRVANVTAGTEATADVHNCTFDNCGDSGTAYYVPVHFETGKCSVSDCRFINTPANHDIVLFVGGSTNIDNIRITDNYFTKGVRLTLSNSNSTNVTIGDNTFDGCNIESGGKPVNDTFITDNRITNGRISLFRGNRIIIKDNSIVKLGSQDSGNAILFDADVHDAVVEKNYINNYDTAAEFQFGTQTCTFRNNILENVNTAFSDGGSGNAQYDNGPFSSKTTP